MTTKSNLDQDIFFNFGDRLTEKVIVLSNESRFLSAIGFQRRWEKEK